MAEKRRVCVNCGRPIHFRESGEFCVGYVQDGWNSHGFPKFLPIRIMGMFNVFECVCFARSLELVGAYYLTLPSGERFERQDETSDKGSGQAIG